MTGWRAALRVARRSVRRHLGRSLLIVALIALPVMAVTVADGILRTLTNPATDLDQDMGTADAKITLHSRKTSDVLHALPSGARAVPLSSHYVANSLRLSVGDRIVRTRLNLVALGDPLTAHLARLTEGRLPDGPGETLVTTPLAERLGLLDADGHLRPRASIGVATGPKVGVTGLAVEPYCLGCAEVVAPQDTLLRSAALYGSPRTVAYLVDLPFGIDAEEFARTWPLTTSSVTTRESFHYGVAFGDYVTANLTEPLLLLGGFALLGIVITAAAAFTVGTRSQQRELGLVAVNGGAAKHVRRIVLAQGVVLGVLGAVTGLVVGAVVLVLGVPLWQRVTGQLMENLRFGWAELAATAAAGVLASVVASVVPAFAIARTQPVDALHRTRPKGRFLGVAMIVAGAAAIAVSGVVIRTEEVPDRMPPLLGTLAGVLLAMAGIVLVMPAMVTAVGRLGDRLPLSGRLAVRDAARHPHRTVAAGAAIMATVSASVVTAFVFTAQTASETRTLPPNTAIATIDVVTAIDAGKESQRQQLEQATTNVTTAVPGAVVVPIAYVTSHPGDVYGPTMVATSTGRPGCPSDRVTVGVATPQLIELATGHAPDAGVRAALAEGKAVSYDECVVEDGTVVLWEFDQVRMPAHLASASAGTENWSLPKVFLSPEAAAARGWAPHTEAAAVVYPESSDLDTIRTAVDDAGADLFVPKYSGGRVTGLYYLFAGLAGLVAFIGAGVTVALSAADGRSDLATLATLGAPPRGRRMLAGAQALVVTGLGTVTGLAVGACAAFAAVPIAGMTNFPVPWQNLLITVLAVPLAASLLAGLATRSPRS